MSDDSVYLNQSILTQFFNGPYYKNLTEYDQKLLNVTLTFSVPPDQDVVGTGALVGFIVAGGLTQIFALFLHRLKGSKSHALGPNGATAKTHIVYKFTRLLTPSVVKDNLQFWINIVSALLIGLSDQQVLMGVLLLYIIIATKGASFSLYYSQYISFFTLITHAATIVSMRPYFRKYPRMTAIRIGVMLAGYAGWIFSNVLSLNIMREIMHASWYPLFFGEDQTVVDMRAGLLPLFIWQVTAISWVYLSMVPSLFLPGSLVKVRKAVAVWPLRRGPLDDHVIRDWVERRDMKGSDGSIKGRLGNMILFPATTFCRIILRTKSKPLRAVLWLVAEIVSPWTLNPLALLALFITLLISLCVLAGLFKGTTEWTFGQVLPIAVVGLPFWQLAQAYSEDWQGAIEDERREMRNANRPSSEDKMLKEKQSISSNDVFSISSPIDGESVEAQPRPRSAIFRK